MSRNKPLYKSAPEYRKYEDYLLGAEYTKGWNDAMDFIFPEYKEKREKQKRKEEFRGKK